MPAGDIEVQRTATGRWRLVIQGTYRTQAEAEAAGNHLARRLGVESFVRGLLGRLLRRNTYGNDPTDIPG